MKVRIVETINQAVEERGIPQAEIARRANLDPAQLSRLLRGERVMKLPALEKLCEVLELELRPVEKPKRKGKA